MACLRATERRVYAINPLAVARYRERHTLARKKSGHLDAKMLARQHGPALIAAAHDSGLNLIHHTVAVTEPATGPNRRREPTSSVRSVSILDAAQPQIRQHILMFVIGGHRRG